MFDKIFDVFRKVDRTISAIDSMQRTADRNVSQMSSRGWKWFILIGIIIIAVLYSIFG